MRMNARFPFLTSPVESTTRDLTRYARIRSDRINGAFVDILNAMDGTVAL